jgi:hypothetical protein
MEQIWLAHGYKLIENCEDLWDEMTHADITSLADDTAGYFQVGSYSVKHSAGDTITTNSLLATEVIAVDLKTDGYTHVALWARADVARAAGDVELLLSEAAQCATPSEELDLGAMAINEWTGHCLALASPGDADLDTLISVGLRNGTQFETGDDVWFDEIFATTATQFDMLAVRGLHRPEDVLYFPPIQEPLLDGTIHEDINGFRRRITLDFEPTTDLTKLKFLDTWARADYKYIISTNDIVRVVLEDPEGQSLEWLGGFQEARKPMIVCLGRSIRTSQPPSWGYS